MKRAIIENIPDNIKTVFDIALAKSFKYWIDEFATEDNPSWQRKPSKLSYTEAYEIVKNNRPHWTIIYRDGSISIDGKDYWEFSGCNIQQGKYGSVFIWILVDVDKALKIFEKFNLKIKEYGNIEQ